MADSDRPQIERVILGNSAENPHIESLPHARWRLIFSSPADGALNMAIDEALSEAVRAGTSLPALRFYDWEPPCLSLGVSQEWEVADFERCAELGWDVVRRATGGRAVLHIDELTYSVTAPENEPRVTGGVLESYRRLSIALYRGLQTLGVTPERAQGHETNGATSGPACFDEPSNYEVTALQRKLVGSAQKRGRGVVLQHGSLPLLGDVSRVRLGLRFESEEQRATLEERLHQQATTLAEALAGRAVSWRDSADAIRTGFEHTLNISFEEIALNSAELARAHQIRAEKYANDAWTKRK